MKATFKVEGFKELDEALGDLKKATARNVMRRALAKAAQPLIDEMRRLAPVRSGRLRASIRTGKITKDVADAGAAAYRDVINGGGDSRAAMRALRDVRRSASVGMAFEYLNIGPDTSAPHAHLQEFGTVRQPPRPFMRPAFDGRWRDALDIIGEALREEIDKVTARARRKAERDAAKIKAGG